MPFCPFFGGGFKKGTLILDSLLEDLEVIRWPGAERLWVPLRKRGLPRKRGERLGRCQCDPERSELQPTFGRQSEFRSNARNAWEPNEPDAKPPPDAKPQPDAKPNEPDAKPNEPDAKPNEPDGWHERNAWTDD